MPVVIYEEYGDLLLAQRNRRVMETQDIIMITSISGPRGDAYVAADSYVLYTSNFLSKKIQGLTGDGKCYG